ncbi:MAG: DUF4080 domain-containing protein [Clostridia bacterium]|nr:DUF4080 domain-containing protein [Clostridia bacterium]
MQVVICSLNSQYIHSSLAPWCLRAGVVQYGDPALQVSVIEGTVNQDPVHVAAQIIAPKPALVGFCCYIWNITHVRELAGLVKQALPQVKIALGGPEVGYCANMVLQENPCVDFVLTGEGERSFALLCNTVLHQQPPMVAGVTYRQREQTVALPPEPLTEEPPSPYCDEYFSGLQGRITYLETSRGCPYACAYCLSARCGKLKFIPIERAKRELLLLANSGTKTVKLVDRTFNAHRNRAKELWRFIIDNYGSAIPSGVCFHFEIAGDLLDEESIAIIRSAPIGSMQFEVGIQSFHEPTLAYIRRKTDLNKLTHMVGQLLACGNVHVHIDLIAGLPLEDYLTFQKSVNQAYRLGAHMLQLGFLKLIHGAPMREDPCRYPCRFHVEPPYEVIETPWLTEAQLKELHLAEWAIDRLYNSGRFSRSLQLVLEQTKQPPYDLFFAFGKWVESPTGASLEKVAQAFYDFAQTLGVPADQLRDAMVCDWLESVKGGKLPQFLQVPDSRLKAFRSALRKNPTTAPHPNLPRGTALLYRPLQGVFVDYDQANPVTGKFTLHYVPVESEE